MMNLIKLAGAPAIALLLLAGCDESEEVAEAPVEEEGPTTAADLPAEPEVEENTATTTPEPPAEGEQDVTTLTPEEPADDTLGGGTGSDATAEGTTTGGSMPETTTAEGGTAETDTDTSAIEPAAGDTAAQISPGSYTAGDVTLVLNEDNTFEMSNSGLGQSVQGTYRMDGDTITLSDVSGDQGSAEFPMECTINAAGEGFQITQAQDSCAVLDGMEFQPAG